MTTTLGLPLIIDDERVEELINIRHDPREQGHQLHVTRGEGPGARTTSYDSVDIHHHAPGAHGQAYPPGIPGPLPAGGAQGELGSYTMPYGAGMPPMQSAMAGGALGAYYPRQVTRPISKGAAMVATVNPMAGAALGVSPLAVAGLGVGAMALVITAYVAAMGGLGYWLGGKLAPDGDDDTAYKWGGAIANVLAPGLGIGAVALIAMIKED